MNKPAGGLQARIMLIALLFCIAIVPFASATTVSFSPLDLDEETLLVHNSSGTLVGVYNTSTKGIVLDANESYSILVQASTSNLLANHPSEWFEGFVDKLQTNSVAIIFALFIVVCLGIVASRHR